MGKAQKKTGKNRLDKYYKLAKEQGYRARSAFKLIQLNKKYSFLENARCCIDLCAAPGGWLQVASKYMPVNSLIVGVDLVPIKPIPRVATFAADITTPQCRKLLRGELKDWQADIVLHDGAPNVGTAWVQDAYGQSELVVMALKLAVEFLIRGGIFITKVFRSVDYNNLMWVFNQLFEKVEATKPPSSRNVSAEIFVICQGFLAPKHIDPKFLDPKHVFKELNLSIDKGLSTDRIHANVFQPEKKRRQRDGYEDGNYTLFKTSPVEDFVKATDPIAILGTVNRLTFTSEQEKNWAQLDITTPEIRALCDDLKVLGRGDFKSLLKWRTLLREELGFDVKSKPVEELTEIVEITEVDEEKEIEDELARIAAETSAKAKRERRRANEIKTKTIQRMQLQMTTPMDIGLDLKDQGLEMGQDVFELSMQEEAKSRKLGTNVAHVMDDDNIEQTDTEEEGGETGEENDEDHRVSDLEDEMDGLYHAYRQRKAERDVKFRVKEARKKNKAREEEWGGFENKNDSDSDESEEGGWEKTTDMKAKVGEESSESDEDSEDIEDNYSEMEGAEREPDRTRKKKLITDLIAPELQLQPSRTAQVWFAQDMFKDVVGDLDNLPEFERPKDKGKRKGKNLRSDELELKVPPPDEELDFEIVPAGEDMELWDEKNINQDAKKEEYIHKYGLTTPEAMTLAQQLVNRQKTKTQLINDGFNRYSFNSKDDLPDWFLDDESKHYKINLPVTKEAIAALRAKQRALDARPIKKVAEAKARKKHRAALRLEKAMKKAQGITETTDMTEKEKAAQIEKLMRSGAAKAKSKRAKEKVQVIVAKGANRGVKGRPSGVKGRYTMVDPRMKKELRAVKRKEKAQKKRKRSRA
ncbi:hypothetical protein Clacol_003880 [Clathrus columnatus]|uniref:rRNA methyltransferase n=1 Tax=Clathrus columnatus TaxID=1419009 RepID=A0AAV5A9F8_9AGAM|nr:hypothetical protein Clacol_003880 [Clathrus columnatus]